MANDHSTSEKIHGTIDPSILEDLDDQYKIIKKEKKFMTYNIYLSESIESNFAYVELLDILRSATPKDEVNVYLANYGGSVSTGFQIVNAINDCKSRVHMIVDAPCYSMGAILAIAGSSMQMNPGTFLMFHNYSTTEVGKGLEVRDAINHFYEYFHRYLKVIASPFLTDKELADLRADKDLYISYDDKDLNKRIKRHTDAKKSDGQG